MGVDGRQGRVGRRTDPHALGSARLQPERAESQGFSMVVSR
jgi:hypothetical protein